MYSVCRHVSSFLKSTETSKNVKTSINQQNQIQKVWILVKTLVKNLGDEGFNLGGERSSSFTDQALFSRFLTLVVNVQSLVNVHSPGPILSLSTNSMFTFQLLTNCLNVSQFDLLTISCSPFVNKASKFILCTQLLNDPCCL